ncbi:MAG: EF-P lysine aminoacylase GenX [Ectothiorhodospiraceae bacterium]|nr:EF-P lysine aminoacylase GenX [Ectothiorhodospiraceae bacterium]
MSTDPAEADRAESRAVDWRPGADLAALRLRAGLLAEVRAFFAERGVLEVETPLLGATGTTDLHIESLWLRDGAATFYLQSSPEHAMKRLLAAGSGPIYQLTRAFRAGEVGRLHNREFTILEWYRPGFDLDALMDETEALLARLMGERPRRRTSLREALVAATGIDPLVDDDTALRERCRPLVGDVADGLDRDDCIDLLLSHVVQPALGAGIVTVRGFPASRAAQARLAADDSRVAARFEVFVDGVEVGNAYHELIDAAEMAARFAADRAERARRGRPDVPADDRLVAALDHGLPDCCGIAMGFDRLVMLAAGANDLDSVCTFHGARA